MAWSCLVLLGEVINQLLASVETEDEEEDSFQGSKRNIWMIIAEEKTIDITQNSSKLLV